ncbi:hypothetical protein SP15_297 [Bacillus phage SP-15]|uniref:Uncharacterized protein n=1 Tax=Bacillus phage SP-15 TaxID=1792032 RepID=A0A127AWS3_9CAUD|nr:hypothetical protein SP15_297 [Bacillus phage SP-15]AMM45105.1 hypothetical protein SP15_297 [Bacillus phage SP-15]
MTQQFGIPEDEKIEVQLIGQDGNIFNLMGLCRRPMRNAGQAEKYDEMVDRIRTSAKSYDEALQIIMAYVNVI